MLEACKKLGLNVPLDCRKGDCGTCTVTCGGMKIRACIGKVPPVPKVILLFCYDPLAALIVAYYDSSNLSLKRAWR
jgi:succinate dehydrogenase/fumarate reductase-like Fe-S protein